MELKERIKEIIETMMEMEEGKLGYDDLFEDYDVDSFTAMQLVAMLESEYDVVIPDERLAELISINATAKIIEELKNE